MKSAKKLLWKCIDGFKGSKNRGLGFKKRRGVVED